MHLEQVNSHYETMEKEVEQSKLETQAAKDEVAHLCQTMDRLEQVGLAHFSFHSHDCTDVDQFSK